MKILTKTLTLVLIILYSFSARASHVIGGDIEYECIGPRTWKMRLIIYRDCTGASLCGSMACTQTMTARPNTTLNLNGCNATPNNTTVTLNLVRVEDLGKASIGLCGNIAKNGCDNLGQVIPGTYSPSVEKYLFEGTFDLSSTNTTCTYWDVYWTLCCRGAGIWNLAGSSGQDFRIGATINVLHNSQTPCKNNSPILKNEPLIIACSGQEYLFNMGAIDPDGDILTYEIAPSIQSGGNPVNYQLPGSAKYIFPLDTLKPPHSNYPQKNGPFVFIDSINGNINFTSLNNTPNPILGNFNVLIKQWLYNSAGERILLGITQRDLQLFSINCTNNNLPYLATIPSDSGNRPKFNYSVYAGEQICFTVIAKESDFYPAIPRIDTTYLSWSEEIVRPNKLFFKPTYPIGASLPRPREDSWQFCWQTEMSDTNDKPYYFNISAHDSYCPDVGRTNGTFSIRVDANNAPIINSFSPLSGSRGTLITIIGNYFSNTSIVTFGNTIAKEFTVISPKIITAIIDTGTTGAIKVTTPKGTAMLNGFTYINNTGVAEYVTQSYTIFPNPVSSEIIIESDKPLNNTSFEFMDVNGKVLMSTECNNSTDRFNIDVKTLSPAVYLLRITSQGQTSTVKVVKQ